MRAGMIPVEGHDHRAPVYPRVLDELVPSALHVAEQYANNPVEANHGRLKARLRPMRGLKRHRSARILAAGHAFIWIPAPRPLRDCHRRPCPPPAPDCLSQPRSHHLGAELTALAPCGWSPSVTAIIPARWLSPGISRWPFMFTTLSPPTRRFRPPSCSKRMTPAVHRG